MARHTATLPSGSSGLTLSAVLLSGLMLMPGPVRAEGGYVAPPYAIRRCPPPRPTCHAGPLGYGPSAPVHAYLPRNNALPMYNEPPQRFPEH